MKKLIVIGASSGGVEALKQILSALPATFPAVILIVLHVGNRDSNLPDVLAEHSVLPLRYASSGERLEAPCVLIAPPDRHLLVAADSATPHIILSRGPKENHNRPAIDPLFRSAAQACGAQVIGVVLTGYLDDGTAGLQAIKACGGLAIVQHPGTAFAVPMPTSALENVDVDMTLPLSEIGAALTDIALSSRDMQNTRSTSPAPDTVQVENRFARGAGDIDDLARIATPSTFSCPECQGVLWEVRDQTPQRFRCHTGHSFTANFLNEEQKLAAEDALWAAVRALHEKEKFSATLALNATTHGHDRAARDYEAQAKLAREQAKILTDMLIS